MKTGIVLATTNRHKVREIMPYLRPAINSAARPAISRARRRKSSSGRVKILTCLDFKKIPRIVENGRSFKANAAIKARAVCRATGMIAIADDSGLVVPALGGRPGVYSARFAGPKCDYDDNNRKLLRLMRGLKGARRRAAMVCAVAIAIPESELCELWELWELWGHIPYLGEYAPDIKSTQKNKNFKTGKIKIKKIIFLEKGIAGRITTIPVGKHGFGYDPVFIPAGPKGRGRTFAQMGVRAKNKFSHRALAFRAAAKILTTIFNKQNIGQSYK